MNEPILFIVCVIYNKYIAEITSFNQFINFSVENKGVKLLIVDNSIEDTIVRANKEISNDYIYIFSGGNVGLSRAYNNALKFIDTHYNQSENMWVMIADDDTFFSKEYLANLLETILDINATGKRCSLISTNIKSNIGCMSPFTIKGLNIKAFEGQIGNYYSGVYAINSGLCIKRDLLKLIGDYDEKLFLDYVDIYFFDRVRKVESDSLLIIDGDVYQNFSAVQRREYKNLKGRYLIFKKDFTKYCKVTNKSKMFWLYILFKRRLNILRSL